MLSAAAAVGCGIYRPGSEGFDGSSGAFALTAIGDADLVVHPGNQRSVQVLLTQDGVGPVPNASIHFAFGAGDRGGATLDLQDARTDDDGVATTSVTAGSNSTDARFEIVATAPKLAAAPVPFSVEVIPQSPALEIVGTLGVVPDEDGATAVVTTGISAAVALQIRDVDGDGGGAIAGDAIAFALPAGTSSHWSGTSQRTAKVTTGAGGEAQVLLLTAAYAETSFDVVARSLSGGAPVTFHVVVQPPGTSCTTNAQCGLGQICSGEPGRCREVAGMSCDASNPATCPLGYGCVDGACTPPAGARCDPSAIVSCTSGYCCDPLRGNTCQPECAVSCTPGSHCVAAASCGAGECVADQATPDVTGVWATRHVFDLGERLPLQVKVFAGALRVLDQSVRGRFVIAGLPDWLQSILASLIGHALQMYVPDWVQLLLAIGDDFMTVLTYVRAEGSMQLVRNPDLTHLRGTEVWTSLVFYWLPMCGDDIGGDPTKPPECARIDLAASDAELPGDAPQCKGQVLPTIHPQLRPFTASLSGNGVVPYTLRIDRRQVTLEMGKVILVLFDRMLGLVTPYSCIEEITDCSAGAGNCPLVDCNGFGQDAESASGGLILSELVDETCARAVRASGHVITDLLAGIWTPMVDTLEFGGHATVSGSADESSCDRIPESHTCAAQLGSDDYDALLRGNPVQRDGTWDGAFLFDPLRNVSGAWQATRP